MYRVDYFGYLNPGRSYYYDPPSSYYPHAQSAYKFDLYAHHRVITSPSSLMEVQAIPRHYYLNAFSGENPYPPPRHPFTLPLSWAERRRSAERDWKKRNIDLQRDLEKRYWWWVWHSKMTHRCYMPIEFEITAAEMEELYANPTGLSPLVYYTVHNSDRTGRVWVLDAFPRPKAESLLGESWEPSAPEQRAFCRADTLPPIPAISGRHTSLAGRRALLASKTSKVLAGSTSAGTGEGSSTAPRASARNEATNLAHRDPATNPTPQAQAWLQAWAQAWTQAWTQTQARAQAPGSSDYQAGRRSGSPVPLETPPPRLGGWADPVSWCAIAARVTATDGANATTQPGFWKGKASIGSDERRADFEAFDAAIASVLPLCSRLPPAPQTAPPLTTKSAVQTAPLPTTQTEQPSGGDATGSSSQESPQTSLPTSPRHQPAAPVAKPGDQKKTRTPLPTSPRRKHPPSSLSTKAKRKARTPLPRGPRQKSSLGGKRKQNENKEPRRDDGEGLRRSKRLRK